MNDHGRGYYPYVSYSSLQLCSLQSSNDFECRVFLDIPTSWVVRYQYRLPKAPMKRAAWGRAGLMFASVKCSAWTCPNSGVWLNFKSSMALDLCTSWICLKLQLLRLYTSVSTVDLFSIAHVLKLENSQPLLSQSVCYMRLFLGNIFCRRPLLCNLECWPLLDSSCRWNQWGQSQHELPLAVSSAYQKSRMHSWNTSQNTVGTNKQSTSIQSKENSLIYAWS